MKCPRCKSRIVGGQRVQRYQFTSTTRRTVIAWVHVECVRAFVLELARSVRIVGVNARTPDAPTNILAL